MNPRIKEIESRHIFDTIKTVYDELNTKLYYSVENIKTFSITMHPAFQIWCSACCFAGLGGNALKEISTGELLGSNEFNEGNHAQLCENYAAQLGDLNFENLTRCRSSLKYVNSHLTLDKIKILYSFLIVSEFSTPIIQGIYNEMKKQECVKDHTYADIHLKADNHDDGHGTMMLEQLEREQNITVEEFNKGIDLFIFFLSDIFKKLD